MWRPALHLDSELWSEPSEQFVEDSTGKQTWVDPPVYGKLNMCIHVITFVCIRTIDHPVIACFFLLQRMIFENLRSKLGPKLVMAEVGINLWSLRRVRRLRLPHRSKGVEASSFSKLVGITMCLSTCRSTDVQSCSGFLSVEWYITIHWSTNCLNISQRFSKSLLPVLRVAVPRVSFSSESQFLRHKKKWTVLLRKKIGLQTQSQSP